eukprot:3425045-Alexandrium_andersonii.AAC.1
MFDPSIEKPQTPRAELVGRIFSAIPFKTFIPFGNMLGTPQMSRTELVGQLVPPIPLDTFVR